MRPADTTPIQAAPAGIASRWVRVGGWVACLILLAAACSSTAGEPAPVLSISVNGERQTVVPEGWPLSVRAVLYHPELFADHRVRPIRLAAVRGEWRDFVALEVRDEAGELVHWGRGDPGGARRRHRGLGGGRPAARSDRQRTVSITATRGGAWPLGGRRLPW